MPIIRFQDKNYSCATTESVLDGLNRQGASLPFSCGAGHCHTCMARLLSGTLPAAAQRGLKETQKVQGYFLPCVCQATSDLHLSPLKVRQSNLNSMVVQKQMIAPHVLRLRLVKPEKFTSFAGQSVQLSHQGQQCHFALASINSDAFLELHIQRIDGDKLSDWLFSRLNEGDALQLSMAGGDCFYLPSQQPLLLASTGTGLAATYAILRQAIEAQHPSPMKLFHAAEGEDHCYYSEKLKAISAQYDTIHYYPYMLQKSNELLSPSAALPALLAQHQADFQGWRAYLFGNQDTLNQCRLFCLQHGIQNNDIYADT